MLFIQPTLVKIIFTTIIMSSAMLLMSSCTMTQHEPSQGIILSAHNAARAQHHASKLVWDDTLANYARRYADKCKFKHSSSPYGENLAAGYPSPAAAIRTWYDERSLYSYQSPGFSHATGHFTQVVWKGSKKLGCAYVACNGRNGTPGHYLVCEYSPAGNVVNKNYFAKNVLPQ